jgi:hypothetical protein
MKYPSVSPNLNHSFVMPLRDFGVATEIRKKVPPRIKRSWPRRTDLLTIK